MYLKQYVNSVLDWIASSLDIYLILYSFNENWHLSRIALFKYMHCTYHVMIAWCLAWWVTYKKPGTVYTSHEYLSSLGSLMGSVLFTFLVFCVVCYIYLSSFSVSGMSVASLCYLSSFNVSGMLTVSLCYLSSFSISGMLIASLCYLSSFSVSGMLIASLCYLSSFSVFGMLIASLCSL